MHANIQRDKGRKRAYDLQHPSSGNNGELFLPASLALVPLPAIRVPNFSYNPKHIPISK